MDHHLCEGNTTAAQSRAPKYKRNFSLKLSDRIFDIIVASLTEENM